MTWNEVVRVLKIQIKEVEDQSFMTIKVYIPVFDIRCVSQFNKMDYTYREHMIQKIIHSTELEKWMGEKITLK